ncbi:MAG: Gamma-glutamyltranspeptidase [Gemmatimonadales bacterium]|nr:MAG: Gamma-glutamyltranspeptidase [Gemmatimonadales bacterium]
MIQGAVACGHPATLEAAEEVLRAGGNAYDAVVAALWAACVAEPLLVSPGGGGFLLARPETGPTRVYDFFCQTPGRRLGPDQEDFRKIEADFGSARQAFHIGLGAAAVPGLPAGAFRILDELGRMSMADVVQPARRMAREGVRVNELQARLARVLLPILVDTPEVEALFSQEGRLLDQGDIHPLRELGDFMDVLALEGPDLFYRGEISASLDALARSGGGHLRRSDLESYQVQVRRPLEISFRDHRFLTNPPPSSGGLLVAFGLALLDEDQPPSTPPARAARIAATLEAMRLARRRENLESEVPVDAHRRVLSTDLIQRYRNVLAAYAPGRSGTTHISILDRWGNAAALTASNGEGCGRLIPGVGAMLNNMLGEEDLQPAGFGRWPTDTRLTSMMAPSILVGQEGAALDEERLVVLGSGGSNRIRSAILQVAAALVEEGLTAEEAVALPRLHVEGRQLEIEGGFSPEVLETLTAIWSESRAWDGYNLFFGGVHLVERSTRGWAGAGDPRRDGVARVLAGA